MDLEVGQLVQRYAALRVIDRDRVSRLAASIARNGQQSPVIVVGERVLVDGYHRVAALRALARDLVQVVALPIAEDEGLVLAHRMETARRRSALEDGWLLQELIETHGRTQAALAVELRRPRSWVSQRLGLVQVLPDEAQEAVRRGKIPAQAAMRVLLPMSRIERDHCVRLVAGIGETPVSVREAERIYAAWRGADGDEGRGRVVDHPHLLLKAEEAVAGPVAPDEEGKLVADFEALAGLCQRARKAVRQGVFARANTVLVGKAWKAAGLAFENLKGEVERARPRDTNGDPPSSS
jgi:ParB-like chromosome segregation protein Spo0J